MQKQSGYFEREGLLEKIGVPGRLGLGTHPSSGGTMGLGTFFVAYLVYRLARWVVSAFIRGTDRPAGPSRTWSTDRSSDESDLSWYDDADADPFPSPGSSMSINSATGLPMLSGDESGVDCAGNPFGCNLSDDGGGMETSGFEDSFPDHDPFNGPSGSALD